MKEAIETTARNIEQKTGRSVVAWVALADVVALRSLQSNMPHQTLMIALEGCADRQGVGRNSQVCYDLTPGMG